MTRVKLQLSKEQRYPTLLVRAVFWCVQTMVWLPVLGLFNVHTDANACDSVRGLNEHRKRESAMKVDSGGNIFCGNGENLTSAACRPDALPTELHPHSLVSFV